VNKLYVWWPHNDRNATILPHIDVGHASLDISFNQGLGRAEYVSWWPAPGSSGYNPVGSALAQPAFMDDCVSEGTYSAPELPYRSILFGGLDEDKMRARWQTIKRTGHYQMYYNNCAATVADVLRAGGADLPAAIRYRMGQVIVWTPWDLLEVVQLIVGYSSKIEQLRGQGWKSEDELGEQLMHMPH
jgi:hypothetical protein